MVSAIQSTRLDGKIGKTAKRSKTSASSETSSVTRDRRMRRRIARANKAEVDRQKAILQDVKSNRGSMEDDGFDNTSIMDLGRLKAEWIKQQRLMERDSMDMDMDKWAAEDARLIEEMDNASGQAQHRGRLAP